MARDLDGSGDITLGDIAIDGVSMFAIAGWVWHDTLGDYRPLFSKHVDDTNSIELALGGFGIGDNNEIALRLNTKVGWSSGSPISTGVWQHWMAVFNGGGSTDDDKVKLFVSGVDQGPLTLNASGFPTSTPTNTQSAIIGSRSGAFIIDGKVAEFAIWVGGLPGGLATAQEAASMLAARYSPAHLRKNGLHYFPLIGRRSPEIDLWGGLEGTLTGTAAADHPPIIYPRGRKTLGKTTPVEPVAALTPDADISDGGWTDQSGGTSLFEAVDETVPSDAEYIRSHPGVSVDPVELRLSNPASSFVGPLRVAYRARRSAQGGVPLVLLSELLQGSSVISAWVDLLEQTHFIERDQFLTAAEFAAITDFDDLRVRLTAIPDGYPRIFGSDLAVWYRADKGVYSDAGSAPASDGDGVQQWNDQSGNAYHQSQSDSGLRPKYRATMFGRPAVVFNDGRVDANSMLSGATDGITLTSAVSVLFVGSLFAQASGDNVRAVSFNGSGQGADWNNTASFNCGVGVGSMDISINQNSGSADSSRSYGAYDRRFRFFGTMTTGSVIAYVDNEAGAEDTTDVAPSLGVGTLRVGAAVSHSGERWWGPVHEVVVVKRVLTAAERLALFRYALAKWG